MKIAREKCGCTYEPGERQRWVEMCAEHKAESGALHQRAQQEYQAGAKQRDAEGFYNRGKHK